MISRIGPFNTALYQRFGRIAIIEEEQVEDRGAIGILPTTVHMMLEGKLVYNSPASRRMFLALATTGASTISPSSDSEPRPSCSASSDASITRLARSTSR